MITSIKAICKAFDVFFVYELNDYVVTDLLEIPVSDRRSGMSC